MVDIWKHSGCKIKAGKFWLALPCFHRSTIARSRCKHCHNQYHLGHWPDKLAARTWSIACYAWIQVRGWLRIKSWRIHSCNEAFSICPKCRSCFGNLAVAFFARLGNCPQDPFLGLRESLPWTGCSKDEQCQRVARCGCCAVDIVCWQVLACAQDWG